MDHDLGRQPHRDGVDQAAAGADWVDRADGVDWVDAEVELDECDGYLVLAVDPQTGEVDAHGPYAGLGAVHAAEDMRAAFACDDLDDVLVRIVRWHLPDVARAPST